MTVMTNRRMKCLIAGASALLLLTGSAFAAPRKSRKSSKAEAEAPTPSINKPPQTYAGEGRRDPFRPTIGALKGGHSDCSKYVGTSRGILLDEVALTAIMASPKGGVATFEGGPDKQGYFMKEGDQFCDGTIHTVDYDQRLVIVRRKLNNQGRRLMRDYQDVTKRLYPDDGEAAASGLTVTVGGSSGERTSSSKRNAGAASRVREARNTVTGARR